MKILAKQIAKELKKAKHCAIYEPELTRFWPDDGKRRETEVARFAEQHGFRLRFYKEGFCAIFDKLPSRSNHKSASRSNRATV
jgi:hypothetical protein